MIDVVRQRNAGPFGLIERYLMPASLPDALTRLAAFCDQVAVLDLYQHLFPTEFAASEASLVAEDGHAYSPREIEFFELTEARCFPFPAAQFRQAQERQETFWIPFFGIDHEHVPSLSILKGGWQLIYFFMVIENWGVDGEDIAYWLDEMDHGVDLAPLLREAAQHGVYQHRFLAECRGEPEPLCYLPEAYEVCAQETGNVFYEPEDEDAADEEESGRLVLRFTRDVFEQVTDAWCEAQAIETHCDALMAWLDEDPQRYVEVATLWAKHIVTHP